MEPRKCPVCGAVREKSVRDCILDGAKDGFWKWRLRITETCINGHSWDVEQYEEMAQLNNTEINQE